jgi:DNA-directed RNA polymerase III subunit RPC7
VPVAAIPTEKEKREVAFYLGLRDQIHKGPLYTAPQTRDAKPTKVYGEDQFNDQFHNKMKLDVDPFEGMPRYSWRYDQQKRVIPQLSARPFGKSASIYKF